MTDGAGTAERARRPNAARSTHFVFEHKLFRMDGGYFAQASDTREAVFHIPLGAIKGAVPVEVLRAELKIPPDSHDGRLLGIIDRSLRYVKEIRPNDSIPHEILDGTASWSVEAVHRKTAESRLMVNLVSWMAGEPASVSSVEQLNALAEAPDTREKVQTAFAEIADQLGIGRERKEEIVGRIGIVARELAYIEALRSRCGLLNDIARGIEKLMRVYSSNRATAESLDRMRRLIQPPLISFAETLAETDKRLADVPALLRDSQAAIGEIRSVRDDLHCRLMIWDDMIEQWQGFKPARSDQTDDLIRATYHFLARNFCQSQPWKLGSF